MIMTIKSSVILNVADACTLPPHTLDARLRRVNFILKMSFLCSAIELNVQLGIYGQSC